LPASALDMFRAHRWPGNVRELRNVVRRMQMLPELPFTVESHRPPSAADDSVAPVAEAAGSGGAPAAPSQVERRVVARLRGWRASEAAHTRADWLSLEDARREFQDAFELDYLAMLEKQSGGNKTRAAILAGVSRQAIQKLVRKHDIDWRDGEADGDPG
jgi:two-component system nitrogen regulation response regulator GlnG